MVSSSQFTQYSASVPQVTTTQTPNAPQNVNVTSTSIKLDVGCGDKPREGHIGIDRKLGGEMLPRMTLGDGRTFEDNSVDEIYCSHALEHLGHWESRDMIREWHRVLKPGGRLRVAVPDMQKIFFAYTNGVPVNVGGYCWGGQTDADDYHRTGFDEGLLTANLEHFGFENCKRWTADLEDCARLPISLNIECTKRHRRKLDTKLLYPITNCRLIQSMPRLGFTANLYGCAKAWSELGINPTFVQGVNWGQCLERAMETALTDGTEWILTADYDSVFSTAHIITMWNTLFEDSKKAHVSALAPIEFKREENVLLAGLLDESTGKRKQEATLADIEPDIVPVEWAHFGLTFIRVEALRRMKKPWFYETPAPNGGWGDGRIDNDINFWHGLRSIGGQVFVAPHVAIGHAQLIVTWPDQNMQPIYQYMGEWNKTGMPEGARV